MLTSAAVELLSFIFGRVLMFREIVGMISMISMASCFYVFLGQALWLWAA